MELTVKSQQRGGVAVLAAMGEIDLFTAPELDAGLTKLIREGHACVVVDLTEVSFLDSTGLGVLVKALKAVRTSGGELRLVVNSERIQKILEVTGLDVSIPVFEDIDAATAG